MAKRQRNNSHKRGKDLDVTPKALFGFDAAQTGSQVVSTAPTLKMMAFVRDTDDVCQRSMEFHMTIRTKVTRLTTKQASMLLSICNVRALLSGVDFTLYLSMEYLYNVLWSAGRDPLEQTNEKVRQTIMVADIIMSYIRGDWLTFRDFEKIPSEIKEEILDLDWLPNERTLNSWKAHWKLESYLEVRIVPVESLINRDKYSTMERYSGYTRGYGNDGTPAHPGRTKSSPELDGDDSERSAPQLSLLQFEEYQSAIRLIEYAKARRKQSKY